MTHDERSRLDTTLAWSSRAMVAAAGASTLGLLIDDRQLLGVSVWVKPLKFSVSISIIVAGLRWLRRRLPRDRWVDVAAAATIMALTIEQSLIVLQAARGVRSHFNGSTPFDNRIYEVMGMFVGVVFIAALVVGWRSFRHPASDPVARTVISAGSVVMLLGMVVGVAMTLPLPNQELPVDVLGAHSIGGADGGAGLPFLGWSTEHGDLRVAHFVGLHALHMLIVAAALLRRRRRSWAQTRPVILAGGTSLGVATVLFAIQALAGRSVVSASTVPIAAVTLLSAVAVVRFPASRAGRLVSGVGVPRLSAISRS